MRKSLVLFILMVTVCGASLFAQTSAPATVIGTVTDHNGARIKNATIVVSDPNSGTTTRVRTDDEGNYELQVSAGTYKFEVSSPGFCPRGRSGVEVGKGERVEVNISLMVCSLESIVVIDSDQRASGMQSRYQVPYKEDLLAAETKTGANGNIEVQYGGRTVLEGHPVYGPIQIVGNITAPVRLTYNKVQVYASSIKAFPGNIFVANGRVLFEDGRSSEVFDSVVFQLKDGGHLFLCKQKGPR